MRNAEQTDFELVGARLQLVRESLQKNQAEFAKAAKVTRTAYNNVETGKQGISRDMLIKLCLKYGLTADYVLFGTRHSLPSHIADRLSEFESVPDNT